MTIEYEFVNVDTNLATQVFVTNSLWQTPAQTCYLGPEPESQFFYTAWQYLNASQGAREYFAFGENLSIVARTVGAAAGKGSNPDATQRRSDRTSVHPGGQYLVFPGTDNIRVVRIGSMDTQAVSVVAAPSGVNPFSLAIDWHLDESRIGVTEPLSPRVTALYQAGERLLFQAVDADNPPPRQTPAELCGATGYQAPSYATKVKVAFRKQGDGKPGYTFSPPSRTP